MEHIYHLPQFGENWFSYQKLYSKFVKELSDNSRIVEVGAWKGKSVAYLAVEVINSKKNIKVDAVDTWLGDPNESIHQQDEYVKNNKLYELFLSNIEPVKHVINPVQMDSVEAAKLYADESIDAVFIDAAHDYENVKKDILAWYPKVKRNGYISGHDYYHPPVKAAVDEMLSDKGVIHYSVVEGTWCLKKENMGSIKTYQLCMFYNELDLLELQLEEHFNYVDKFVIVESTKTHSGKEKELFFANNASRFEKYKEKIVHLVCDFDSELYKEYSRTHGNKFGPTSEQWKRENFQRDYPLISGDIEFNDDDILIVCDVDEIPNTKTVTEFLQNNKFIKDPYRLEMYFMHYYINTSMYIKNSGEDNKWYHPFITRYADVQNYNDSLSFIRTNSPFGQNVIRNGGWHFSYLLDTNGILNKIRNFAHSEDSNIRDVTIDDIKDSIAKLNIFYDQNIKLKEFPTELLPNSIRNNLQKWNKFLLNGNKKSLVIIGAYPNSKIGIDILKQTIAGLKDDFDILLSTHYPADKDIQEMVKYYVYDHRNEMIPHKYADYNWWCGDDNVLIQQKEGQVSPNYHYAVYRLIMNGLSLLKDYYEDFYYIESDCIFEKSDIEKLKALKTESLQNNKQACFFGNDTFFFTLLFWSKIDYFLKVVPLLKTPDEFVQATDSNNCIENYLPECFIKNDSLSNVNILLDEYPSKYFDKSKLAQLSISDGNTVSFQARVGIVKEQDSNNLFFIFKGDVNHSSVQLNVKIDDDQFTLTNGDYFIYKQVFPKSDKIRMEVNGRVKTYIIDEILRDTDSFIKFFKKG